MPSTGKCPFCGSVVKSNEARCPNCGSSNENYVADTERTVFLPKTIDELKEYCAERGMPLLRMRFFIGEDFKEPRAFGIYRDGDEVVVYKNKADGSRAIRYRGKDEEYGVNELFTKLLDECHSRGIYPDGKPEKTERYTGSSYTGRGNSRSIKPYLIYVIIFFLLLFGIARCSHRNDGYYRVDDHGVYYKRGSDWYYSGKYSDDWQKTTEPTRNYKEYYEGENWNSGWGGTSFKESETWRDIQERNSSSSSDYDSWDSGGTDWDTDW